MKSNKNKKKDVAEEVQEDVADHFMEIATEQVQEGVIVLFQEGSTEQVQEEIENQHAKVDGNGKEIVEFNFENGGGAEGNVDEFEDAIYEQNAAETERIMRKFFYQDRDGETERRAWRPLAQRHADSTEREGRPGEVGSEEEREAEGRRRRSRGRRRRRGTWKKKVRQRGKKKVRQRAKKKERQREEEGEAEGLEGVGSEKDIEGEKGGAGSEKIVSLEVEESVAMVATEKKFCRSKCGSCSEYATAQEAEKSEAAKDDKAAETATAKATEKGKVENEAQPATSPRTRSIVKRIKERRDRKEKKLEDYEVQRLKKTKEWKMKMLILH
ncbi:hypothetical protein ACLB2K_026401 [Fragaria x ananassa]